jgi:hypothetical protein
MMRTGGPLLAIPPLDDPAFIGPDTNGDAPLLAGGDHPPDLGPILDVPRIEADLVCARGNRLQRPLEVEMHVGDDRHRRSRDDLLEGLGVAFLRHCHAHEVRPHRRQAPNLLQRLVDLVRIRAGHRLQGNGRIAADLNGPDRHLPCFSTWGHGIRDSLRGCDI